MVIEFMYVCVCVLFGRSQFVFDFTNAAASERTQPLCVPIQFRFGRDPRFIHKSRAILCRAERARVCVHMLPIIRTYNTCHATHCQLYMSDSARLPSNISFIHRIIHARTLQPERERKRFFLPHDSHVKTFFSAFTQRIVLQIVRLFLLLLFCFNLLLLLRAALFTNPFSLFLLSFYATLCVLCGCLVLL